MSYQGKLFKIRFTIRGLNISSFTTTSFHAILLTSMKEYDAITVYQQEKKKFEEQLAELKGKQNLYGWLRLSIIIITALVAFYLFNSTVLFGIIVVVIGIFLFLIIVSFDTYNNKKI